MKKRKNYLKVGDLVISNGSGAHYLVVKILNREEARFMLVTNMTIGHRLIPGGTVFSKNVRSHRNGGKLFKVLA